MGADNIRNLREQNKVIEIRDTISQLDCNFRTQQERADQCEHKMAGYLIHCDDPLIKSYSDLDGVA